MSKLLVLLFGLLLTATTFAQEINIVPRPVSVRQPKIASKFSITPNTIIVLEGSNLEKIANYFNDYCSRVYSLKLKIVSNSESKNTIRLNYERWDAPAEGAYVMTIDNDGVYIAGDNEAGVFYGIQTLIQLLSADNEKQAIGNNPEVPFLSIMDYPRFQYRGMHLDVSRHFFPVSFIKKYIDYLAFHKLNTFHWHLTDDQGWRIEIKKYPKLTAVGAYRNGTIIGRYPGTGNDGEHYGDFYTQEEIKEVVKYAADRFITVIPEIEMPGHSSAAIAAYPGLSCFPDEPTIHYFPRQCTWSGDSSGKQVQQTWGVFEDVFCAGKENTFTFLEDVLDEVLTLFPSTYIHVGGDECPKENWKRCPLCQQRMKDNHLSDEHELQSYFIQRIEKYVNSKGRKIIGWDEILEGGLAPNAAVMSWRGEEGGIAAAKQKHYVVMTPGNPVYFDHTQSRNEDSVTIGGYNPIEKVYAYEPIPRELNKEEAKYILGTQANVWTEYMKYPSKVEYMIFPRMAALSEILWSPKEKRNWEGFEKRLPAQLKRYDLWKARYSRVYYDLSTKVIPTDNYSGILWKIDYNLLEDNEYVYYIQDTLSAEKTNEQFQYLSPRAKWLQYLSPIKVTSHYLTAFKVWSDRNKTIYYNTVTQKFHFNKATGKKITLTNPASKKYPGDGAFTLVNGVQNEKGMAKSDEFLGFEGTDCEAVIDLGKKENIDSVIIHSLRDKGSWIWQPLSLEVFVSDDGTNFKSAGITDDFITKSSGNGTMNLTFKSTDTRYIKVKIKNWGTIPEGNPGAGNKSWLFVDEIEIN